MELQSEHITLLLALVSALIHWRIQRGLTKFKSGLTHERWDSHVWKEL